MSTPIDDFKDESLVLADAAVSASYNMAMYSYNDFKKAKELFSNKCISFNSLNEYMLDFIQAVSNYNDAIKVRDSIYSRFSTPTVN